jgi:hypothetical protein
VKFNFTNPKKTTISKDLAEESPSSSLLVDFFEMELWASFQQIKTIDDFFENGNFDMRTCFASCFAFSIVTLLRLYIFSEAGVIERWQVALYVVFS